MQQDSIGQNESITKKQVTPYKRSFKEITKKPDIEYDGRFYAVQEPRNGKGNYKNILTKILEQFHACFYLHKRVIAASFTIHLDYFSPDNKPMSTIIKKLDKWFQIKYDTRFAYVWAREETRVTGNTHFHLYMLADHNKVATFFETKLKLDVIHGKGVHMSKPKNNKAESLQELEQIIFHASYLAKVNTKTNRPKQTKDYGSTRFTAIKKRNILYR